MAQSMDNKNDVVEVFSRFLAHMLAKNCHTFEACVEISEGIKNRYEAAELAFRARSLGFPTNFETRLQEIENRPYNPEAKEIIGKFWQKLWNLGGEDTISDIEEWQYIVMKKMKFVGYSLMRAKSEEFQTFFGHQDLLDTSRLLKKQYYDRSKDAFLLPSRAPSFVSNRNPLNISIYVELEDLMSERPITPTPADVLDFFK